MEIKIIAVIGADIVGRDIACLAALAGYRVILEDVSDDRLGKAANWILEKLESCVVCNPVPARIPRDASETLVLAHTVEDAIRDADLVIETLPDEMEMQIEIFTILDKFAKPNAIFASTGSLSIAELAEVTFCADRCIGMRFPGSVEETKIVELIKSSETSGETIAVCTEVARRMGREVVVLAGPAANIFWESERKLANAKD